MVNQTQVLTPVRDAVALLSTEPDAQRRLELLGMVRDEVNLAIKQVYRSTAMELYGEGLTFTQVAVRMGVTIDIARHLATGAPRRHRTISDGPITDYVDLTDFVEATYIDRHL